MTEPTPGPLSDALDDQAVGNGEPSVLARRAVSGIRWGLVSTSTQQIVRVLFTLVLARLIGPEDFGITAQATIFIGFTQLFIDQGFGAALIQKRSIDRLDIGSVFWLNVVFGTIMALITIAAAPLMASFFRTPELTNVLRVLSILVLVNALAVVPTALLNREMGWRAIALSQFAGVLVGGVAGLAAAAADLRYWSIVVQSIVTSAVTLAGMMLVTGAPPLVASLRRLRELFAFTWGVMGSYMLRYLNDNVDNILIGRYLGPADLAFYALAFRLLKLPIRLIGAIVNQVSLPAFSRMQDDLPRIRRWFLTSSQTMATASYPFLMLGILLAPDLIPALFGSEWEPAVVPTQILTAVAMRQIVMMLIGPLFQAMGRTRAYFGWTVVSVVTNLVGIVIGLQWGIVGVAAGVAIAMYALAPLQIAVAARLVGFHGSEYTRALAPAWISVAAMVVAWIPVRLASEALGIPTFVAVAIASLAALGAYVATLRFGFKELYIAMRDVASVLAHRKGRNRDAATPAAP